MPGMPRRLVVNDGALIHRVYRLHKELWSRRACEKGARADSPYESEEPITCLACLASLSESPNYVTPSRVRGEDGIVHSYWGFCDWWKSGPGIDDEEPITCLQCIATLIDLSSGITD